MIRPKINLKTAAAGPVPGSTAESPTQHAPECTCASGILCRACFDLNLLHSDIFKALLARVMKLDGL